MNLVKKSTAVIGLAVVACGIVHAAEKQAGTGRAAWTQSYDAGYKDGNGAWAGGSEIMHLAPHKGKLFAANGYWVDSRWAKRPYEDKQSAQVLRLDRADGRWQVDLDMGKANEHGLRYMKGNILKSVTFTRDAAGKLLPKPQNLLVAAAGAYKDQYGIVSAWVRDDATGRWNHRIVKHGLRAGGTRWIPRDMQVYRDKVTGRKRLFLLIGNPGIISGVYDASQPLDAVGSLTACIVPHLQFRSGQMRHWTPRIIS